MKRFQNGDRDHSPLSVRDEETAPDCFPLSPAQERLWFLDQLEPGSAAYNVRVALRFEGCLDQRALHQSLNEIVRRHESLRTRFRVIAGQPRQEISRAAPLTLPLVDLSDLAEPERRQQTEVLARAAAQKAFDLSSGPLLRCELLRLSDAEHVLLLSLHHIITDGWSMGVLFAELSKLYNAYSAGQSSPLPELAVQYADYAVWQRAWLQGEVLEEQLNYWRVQLADAPPVLTLPTDRPRTNIQSHHGEREPVLFDATLTQQLKELSQRAGATLFMTLLAAFQVLLSRYSDEEDILVGTPIAGRRRAEVEPLIGLFLNTLILRTMVNGEESFAELLLRVRHVCLEAYVHQDLPFELLLDDLKLERTLSRHPLFQVMLQWQPSAGPSVEMNGLKVRHSNLDNATAKFELTLALGETAAGLAGSLEYNTDLWTGASARRLLSHFTNLLRAVIAQPNVPIETLSLSADAERRQLLQDWNQTAAEFSFEHCLHQQFERQARRTPDRVAASCGDEQLSYEDLNGRANQLAHYLQSRGVGPEVLVAVCLERSPEMLVALLAILKAGGAYVPLDPAYPLERIRFMLADANVAVLLIGEKSRPEITEIDAQIVSLDLERAVIAEGSRTNLRSDVSSTNLAYVIYTSGSTGQPKGVQITHRNLSNFMSAMAQQPGLRAEDVLVALTTLSFDIAALELFLPLLTGARVVLASDEIVGDGESLARLLEQVDATVLQATPMSWRLLLENGWQSHAGFKALCGGEALSPELAQALLNRQCELWNMYGPTESTVWSVIDRVENVSDGVLIGRPIQNTEVYVLDAQAEPVPLGLRGELYIGGEGVARGYLQHPELTAAAFVPDPFSGRVGARLYRTGDVARWRAEGKLEFCGRADTQVKLRGQRIELGEIEAALDEHSRVKQSVAVVRTDESNEPQLVAYVVASLDDNANGYLLAELWEYLRARVPRYMVPAIIVTLPEMPLTANGKVDRRRLPEPESQPAIIRAYAAPRTAVEEMLCGIWSRLLHLPQVGIHDNFFQLGGHSLLVTQVTAQASKAFGIEIQTRTMFEFPTIHGLADEVEKSLSRGARVEIPPLLRVPREASAPLSSAQERLWFLDQLEPGSAAYNVRVALRFEGCLDQRALHQGLNEIVRRHESLRTRFHVIAGQPRQEICRAAPLTLPLVDLSDLAEPERRQQAEVLARAAAQKAFDLSSGPLLRCELLRLSDAEHVLLLSLHHIITDGWSMGVLFAELSKLYNAYAAGQSSPLPELAVQYADYAVWQRAWLQGEVLEEQLNYWRLQLADAPPVLTLPTDYARPLQTNKHWGRPQVMELSSELSGRLKEISRSASVTLFMTLLAAFQVLLSRYSGAEDIVVGTPIAGRDKTETQDLIGLFINTLVLRTNTSGNPTFAELLLRVREVCLGAYTHQEVPLENLVKELQPHRTLNHNPLFQVVFQLQNEPPEPLSLSCLAVSPMAIEGGMINLDLSVSIKETATGLKVILRYDDDLFTESTTLRLLGHYRQILESSAADPTQRLAQLRLLTAREREQVLYEWNSTATEYAREFCVHELFEQQAVLTAERVAVIFEDTELSYGELNWRANQLAHYLRARGVGAETVVGVCLESSLEMVVALLGILKAGGAYVPLDPGYPVERLRWMREDAEALWLITAAPLVERVAGAASKVICLDSEATLIAQERRENPEVVTQPDNAAYLIYTSGSSGRPRGVVVTHGNLVNFVQAARAAYEITGADRVLQFASISFDTSAEEIYPCLTTGATLVLRGAEMISSAAEFLSCCEALRLTVLDLPTAYWHELVQQLDFANVQTATSLRLVIIGGEKALPEHWSTWRRRIGAGTRLTNTYGPTEATIVTTIYDAPIEPAEDLREVPIGRPIANARIYILDKQMQSVPVRVTGEIYIGGRGVAREYLRRPELTAERFVPDPFSDTMGARLYRSGDLGRYRVDGQIEYVGRSDNQVKVRGFRIELGEIEAALNEYAGVCAAAVCAFEKAPGDNRLAAYIVAEPGRSITANQLREHLKGKLPDYMLPSAFMMLDSLPLTASGKLDRKALPAPDGSGGSELGSSQPFVSPRTPAEKEVAQIWLELLGIEVVGIHDNFFAIGGHSLLLTRLASRINIRFQLNLPLRALFNAPTILAMTETIVAGQLEREDADEIDRMLSELQQLTPDQVRILAESST